MNINALIQLHDEAVAAEQALRGKPAAFDWPIWTDEFRRAVAAADTPAKRNALAQQLGSQLYHAGVPRRLVGTKDMPRDIAPKNATRDEVNLCFNHEHTLKGYDAAPEALAFWKKVYCA